MKDASYYIIIMTCFSLLTSIDITEPSPATTAPATVGTTTESNPATTVADVTERSPATTVANPGPVTTPDELMSAANPMLQSKLAGIIGAIILCVFLLI